MRYLLKCKAIATAVQSVSLAPHPSRALSSFSKLMEYVAKPPSQNVPAWTRLARNVKSPDATPSSSPDSKHLENIRKACDVEDTIGKLEHEFMEEMAGALGRTGNKAVYYFNEMRVARAAFDRIDAEALAAEESNPLHPSFSITAALSTRREAAQAYHRARQLAEDARRELIIHRQACGFIHNNYSIVENAFPLLPLAQVTSLDRVHELKGMSKHELSLLDKPSLKAELCALGVARDGDGGGGAVDAAAMARSDLLALLARAINAL